MTTTILTHGFRFEGSDEVIANLYAALIFMKGKKIEDLNLEAFDEHGGHLNVMVSPFTVEDQNPFKNSPILRETP